MLEESLALFRELRDREGVAISIQNLVYARAHGGDSARLVELREEAEALRTEALNQRTLAHLLDSLTLAVLDAYDYERALAYAREAVRLHREVGDVQGLVISLTALGLITLEAGDPERARPYFEENLRLLRQMGHKMGIAYCLLGLAGVAGEHVRPDRAARLWGAAEALREAIGMQLSPFDRSHYRYEERLAAARSLMDEEAWDTAWAEGKAMTPEGAIEYALSEEGAATPTVVAPPEQAPAARSKDAPLLTSREREVAVLAARGLTNLQIAHELSISERTVSTHVSRILHKLGLRSRAQIATSMLEPPPEDR